MNYTAQIAEIFSSIQGEGPYASQPMTFVRFARCSMNCKFCDTPHSSYSAEFCRLESPPKTAQFIEIANPIGVVSLNEHLENFSDDTISVTGGEPLEQINFLEEWLPTQAIKRKILLETNGIHYKELWRILPSVHIVSMDFKLPSASGQRPVWDEHAAFLHNVTAAGKEIYVKMVVTEKTNDRDIQKAINILTKANKYIPLIIQPVSNTLTFSQTISKDKLESLQRLCKIYLPDVRIIPQLHKEWGVL